MNTELTGNAKIVYDTIYNKILSGEYPLGSPISELKISKELNVSRSPVREALRLLEAGGIVVHYANRGTFVKEFTVEDIRELMEMRMQLERMGLKKSWGMIDSSILYKLRTDIENLGEDTPSEEYFLANSALHNALIRFAGNKYLSQCYELLRMQLQVVNRVSAQDPLHFDRSKKEHLQLIQALEKKDYEEADHLLHEHLRSTEEHLLRKRI